MAGGGEIYNIFSSCEMSQQQNIESLGDYLMVDFFYNSDKGSIFNTNCIWKSWYLIKSTLYFIEFFTSCICVYCTCICNPKTLFNTQDMHGREILKLPEAKNRTATMIRREKGSVHDLSVGR